VFCNSSNFILTGVPAFYMNGHKMFSGAQEPDAFKRMFEIAAEKFPLQSSKT
jgi:predicted DsbA family dithiol-disulfide isomerase